MVNKSSKLRQLNTLLLTLLLLLGPFCLYYVFYFSNQKSYFTNRNFRLLAVLAQQIQKKVDNIGVAYGKAAKTAAVAAVKAEPVKARAVKDFGEPGKFILADYLAPITEDGTTIEAKPERAEKADPSALPKESSDQPFVTLNLKQEDSKSWLYFNYIGRPVEAADPVTIHARSTLEDLIGSFVEKFVQRKDFDDVIVADEDGKVIFQQGPAELSVTNLDSLYNKDEKKLDFNLLKQNSNVSDVQLAGTDYKLFIQPVQFSFPRTSSNTEQGARWIVCGLIRSSHFLSESAAISYTFLIVFTFLFIFVALSIPFLKLLFMGSREKLRVADVYFLAFSTLMGSALLTLFFIYACSYRSLEGDMDTQIQELSNQIVTNFNTEMGEAIRELATLDKNEKLQERLELLRQDDDLYKRKEFGQKINEADLKLATLDHQQQLDKLDGHESFASQGSTEMAKRDNYGCPLRTICSGRTGVLGNLVGYDDDYPYLHTVIWIDPQGQQRVKWTTRSKLASFIDTKNRDYFRNILEGRTWEYKEKDQKESYKYRLEPIYSMATGGQQIILSMPSQTTYQKGGSSTWVAAMDIPLLSLFQTVLPDDLGYGYCVIDNDGKVLFHTDESRNLLEDFFAETDNDGYLRSVVLAKESKLLDARYQGVGHRLYVRSIPNTPWSLVAFRNKQILRTAALELIANTIYLFILYALILLLIFSIYYLRSSDNRAALVWPYSKRAANYYLSIIVNLLLALGLGLSLLFYDEWRILALTILLPALGFLLHHYNLKKGPKFGGFGEIAARFIEEHLQLNYRRGYVLALVTLLLLVSVLPMLAFFKFSYDRELKLFVELGQINLARGLEDRAARVQAQYLQRDKNSAQSNDPQAAQNEKEKTDKLRCFVQKRLEFGVGDVYASFFFQTGFEVKSREEHEAGSETADNFGSLLDRVMLFNNTISIKVRGLTQSMAGDDWSGLLRHERVSSDQLMLHTAEKVDGSETYMVLHVISAAPILGRSINGRGQPFSWGIWWAGLIASLVFVSGILFALISFVARRIFLLETDEPEMLYGEELCQRTASQNLLVLCSPFINKDALLKREGFEVIDLRETSKKKSWDQFQRYQRLPEGHDNAIAINYFEYHRDDPEINREKIRLLESLLIRNKRVIIVSTVDLMDYYFDEKIKVEPEQNGHHVSLNGDRGAKLLGSFLRVYIEDRGDPQSFLEKLRGYANAWQARGKRNKKQTRHLTRSLKVLKRECEARASLQKIGEDLLAQAEFENLTAEQVVMRVQDQANAYYHAIWDTCSKDEKFTLYNLARYHLVSSKNCDLRRLLRRGLIVKEPYLRPMNESFARFIIAQSSPERLVAWEQVGEGSNWKLLKVPFFIALLSAAMFLFVSQRELYNSTLALVSTFAATMPLIFKFLGLIPSASAKVSGTGGGALNS